MTSRTDIEDMTDAQDEAPERIWADRSPFGEHSWMDVEYDGGTLYVRAALARPSQAGDERVARLIEAVRGLLHYEIAHVGPYAVLRVAEVRAALAAMDTPKGGGDE